MDLEPPGLFELDPPSLVDLEPVVEIWNVASEISLTGTHRIKNQHIVYCIKLCLHQ